MSPVRTSENGSFRFDRDFSRIGVGRIQRASGTDNRKEFQRRDSILTKLAETAQIDTLKAFKTGSISIEELVQADKDGKLASSLATLQTRRPLWDTLDKAIAEMDCAEPTRRRYTVSLQALRRKARRYLGANARLCDLADAPWRAIQGTWGGSPADWNHMRRAVSTALTTTLRDTYHPFRRQVMNEIPLADEGSGRVPDLSPSDFLRIVEELPEHARSGVMVLVATGMRVGEYMRTTKDHLRPSTFAIDVPGTKTKASKATIQVDERLWHWIEIGIPAPLREGWLRKYWQRACKKLGFKDLRLHDLRHCHGQWAVLGGASEAAVQVALRHTNPEMTRRYTKTKNKGEVARVVGDALLRTSVN